MLNTLENNESTLENNESIIDSNEPSFNEIICCNICNVTFNNKWAFKKHLSTTKHKNNEFNFKKFICGCGKKYKHQKNLRRHQHSCLQISSEVTNEVIANNVIISPIATDGISTDGIATNEIKDKDKDKDKDKQVIDANLIVLELLKQNNEYKDSIIEQNKIIANLVATMGTMGTTIGNNSNNTDIHFNLQIFLNETCKDAANLDDFVKDIIVTLADLENTRALGYSIGVSKIILASLNAIEANKRPIYCTDTKREIMYVKDNGIWEKEDTERKKIKKIIQHVECKSIGKIKDWQKANPNSLITTHKDNTTYHQMVLQVSGGNLKEEEENINKIIRSIAKESSIDKYK